jgi:septum site-determining protein MinC
MATRITKPDPERSTPSVETALTGEGAVLIHRTLRSGFSLQHKGHVVVIGDVNPGSEIAAGGDVVVWGRLRGMVHAGAEGDESAVVCALDLDPTQLRIAGHIAITPKRRGKSQPEMAHVVDGQVVAEPWMGKK